MSNDIKTKGMLHQEIIYLRNMINNERRELIVYEELVKESNKSLQDMHKKASKLQRRLDKIKDEEEQLCISCWASPAVKERLCKECRDFRDARGTACYNCGQGPNSRSTCEGCPWD